ncbi:MAG TPA: SCP2 sterol-binding domain-containing protein, partial [Kofleriaceae bacterium]
MEAFLSDGWFAEVQKLIAGAGDLNLPAPMKNVKVNVTIKRASGDVPVFLQDGVVAQGHRDGADATITLDEDLARKLFVEADAAAGVQAFMLGQLTIEGDLGKVVAMQTADPSTQQVALA